MRIVYREIEEVYLVQLEASLIEERFNVNCNVAFGNLVWFKDEFYKGFQKFTSFDEAKIVLENTSKYDMFIASEVDSKLKEVHS